MHLIQDEVHQFKAYALDQNLSFLAYLLEMVEMEAAHTRQHQTTSSSNSARSR